MPTLSNRYVFILAGGSGKRLWPLGRQALPKQLIPFKEKQTLLDLTIERMSLVVPRENIWIITAPEYAEDIRLSVAEKVGRILIEPEARNTGPAIFYGLQQLQEHNPAATLIVVPSDQVINAAAEFVATIETACGYAENNPALVSCGVSPEFAATGYGYIECEKNKDQYHSDIMAVKKFQEKPSQEIAQSYCDSGNFLWNTGIFCTTVQTLAQEFKAFTTSEYATLPAQSIDYMIFEKSYALQVVKGYFDWSDVGTLDLFVAAKKDATPPLVTLNANNVLAHGTKKLLVVMDVDDICVIETDDVMLITRRSETENIKKLVEYLKVNGYEKFI